MFQVQGGLSMFIATAIDNKRLEIERCQNQSNKFVDDARISN